MPKIWMFDKNTGKYIVVLSDAQILYMFRMYQEEKKIILVVLVCDSDGSSNCSNTTPTFTCNSSQAVPNSQGSDVPKKLVLFDEVDVDMFLDEGMLEGTYVEETSEPIIAYEPDNPIIEFGASYLDAKSFRKALRHFAIQKEFVYLTLKTDKTRFVGKCREDDCLWRIHASMTQDNRNFKVKVLPHEHACPSKNMTDGKMASQS